MRTRSTFWPLVAMMLLSSVVLALASCGQAVYSTPPGPMSQRGVTLPPGETLYLLSAASAARTGAEGGGSGGQLVAVQAASVAPAALLSLPAGLLAADHTALYATRSSGSGGTTVERIDTRTGVTVRSLALPGIYTISGDGWGDATLSADGQWLALARSDQGGAKTVIAMIDTQTMRLTRIYTLDGTFTLDAAANGGHILYLLQTLDDAAHHYYVRAFDTQAGQLQPGYIVDKTELNETWNMAGYAVARQAASDGSVDYTLYIAPGLNQAFIHALPLSTDASGGFFAHCINLPVGASPDLLRFYTLVMAPDGSALYAADAALGVVATISLNGASSNIYADAVTATAHVAPANVASTAASGAGAYAQPGQRPLENGAALSPDGKTLFVAGPGGVHVFDARTLASRGTYLAGQATTSVAAGADGRTLYAVNPVAGVSVIDLASGATLRTVRAPMSGLWGIAWVRE